MDIIMAKLLKIIWVTEDLSISKEIFHTRMTRDTIISV